MPSKICIVGLGYIGLPTAALLASCGHQVVGVDVAESVVDIINDGRSHIAEPKLNDLISAAVDAGRLRATTKPEAADVFLLAVPTPLAGDHRPDLSYLQAAVASIAPVLNEGNLVIVESTVPVGTTEQVALWLACARPDLHFPHQPGQATIVHIAYCPERVLPGRITQELRSNDRVIGGLTPQCSEVAASFYRLFVQGQCVCTTVRTAEMCKLAENSFRDVNIAFANELSILCDEQGINVWELIRLANRHPRVNILQPGCGVGGHCIAVDPWFLVDQQPQQARLVKTARQVNDAKPDWVLNKVEQAILQLKEEGAGVEDIRIACFGISFKPDVADLRESPALRITQELALRYPEQVRVVEPHLNTLPESLALCGVQPASPAEAVQWANVLVLLVNHTCFTTIAPHSFVDKKVIDTRGIWEKTT